MVCEQDMEVPRGGVVTSVSLESLESYSHKQSHVKDTRAHLWVPMLRNSRVGLCIAPQGLVLFKHNQGPCSSF